MTRHNGLQFTTKDRDNDLCTPDCTRDGGTNCALMYYGGWWYEKCHSSNLNGLYLDDVTTEYATGVVWGPWTGYYFSLKTSEMKLRPT